MMPATHDSVWARLVVELLWLLWTGGWIGWTRKLEPEQVFTPAKKHYGKVSLEGVGASAALIGNTGRYGELYEAVKNTTSLNYDQAALAAAQYLPGQIFNPDSYPGDAEDTAAALISKFENPAIALAAILESAAYSSVKNIRQAASSLGVPAPEKAGITGGFSNNRAFRRVLGRRGIEIEVSERAGNATEDGAGAEAYRRYCLATGKEISFRESLALIHACAKS
jgi:sugar (pentulose or hexulose) kinase